MGFEPIHLDCVSVIDKQRNEKWIVKDCNSGEILCDSAPDSEYAWIGAAKSLAKKLDEFRHMAAGIVG